MPASVSANAFAVTQTASVSPVNSGPSAASDGNGFADALQQAAAKPAETQEKPSAGEGSAPAAPSTDSATGDDAASNAPDTAAAPAESAGDAKGCPEHATAAATADPLDGSVLPPWLPMAPAATDMPVGITAEAGTAQPANDAVAADPQMPGLLLQAMRQNMPATKPIAEPPVASAADAIETADAVATDPRSLTGGGKPLLPATATSSLPADQALPVASPSVATSAPVTVDPDPMPATPGDAPIEPNIGVPSPALPSTTNAPPRPAEVATASVPVPINHPQWGEAFASRIAWQVRDGVQQVSLALNPAELGPVEVRLSVSDGQVSAQFHSAHHNVRQAIEEAMPKLRDMLSQSGLNLADANVSQQAPGRDDRAAQPGSRWAAGVEDAGSDAESQSSTIDAPLRSLGLIDAYV